VRNNGKRRRGREEGEEEDEELMKMGIGRTLRGVKKGRIEGEKSGW
jgi:hypothetical protein